jgi:hypothetical protein
VLPAATWTMSGPSLIEAARSLPDAEATAVHASSGQPTLTYTARWRSTRCWLAAISETTQVAHKATVMRQDP